MTTGWLDMLRRNPPPGVKGAELAVLRALAEFADYIDGASCFPSIAALAGRAGVSPGHTARVLRVLWARGLITMRSGKALGLPNSYLIDVAAVEALCRASAVERTARAGLQTDGEGRAPRATTTPLTSSTPRGRASRIQPQPPPAPYLARWQSDHLPGLGGNPP